jgi:hypothetical protein
MGTGTCTNVGCIMGSIRHNRQVLRRASVTDCLLRVHTMRSVTKQGDPCNTVVTARARTAIHATTGLIGTNPSEAQIDWDAPLFPDIACFDSPLFVFSSLACNVNQTLNPERTQQPVVTERCDTVAGDLFNLSIQSLLLNEEYVRI